jgi:hypothetical protein
MREATAALLFAAASIAAQLSGDTRPPQQGINASRLLIEAKYQEILQILPDGVRARLDSVKQPPERAAVSAQESAEGQRDSAAAGALSRQMAAPRDAAMAALPEALRRQVEDAIKQVERQSQERRIEFKERKRQEGK